MFIHWGSWCGDHMSSSFVKQQANAKALRQRFGRTPACHVTKSHRRCARLRRSTAQDGQQVMVQVQTANRPEGTRPAGPPFCLQLGRHSEFAPTCMAGPGRLYRLHCTTPSGKRQRYRYGYFPTRPNSFRGLRSVRIRVRMFNIRYRIRIRILKSYIYDVDIQFYLIRHALLILSVFKSESESKQIYKNKYDISNIRLYSFIPSIGT